MVTITLADFSCKLQIQIDMNVVQIIIDHVLLEWVQIDMNVVQITMQCFYLIDEISKEKVYTLNI
jgi:hypothetical protein